jgi:Xaa-Pro aminopeptidase
MTRTFFVGEVSPKMQEIYHVVQQAQQAVTNISAPGRLTLIMTVQRVI